MYQEHFSDYVLDLDNQILIHFFLYFHYYSEISAQKCIHTTHMA